MKITTIVLGVCLVTLPVGFAFGQDNLKPFTSDGCSAFPEGTWKQKQLWLKCCTAHDFAYWQGGTYKQRLAADEALKECVADVGEPEIALLMLAGVRVGGSPFFPTEFRWGYGWPYLKPYGELRDEEKAFVRQRILEGEANLRQYLND